MVKIFLSIFITINIPQKDKLHEAVANEIKWTSQMRSPITTANSTPHTPILNYPSSVEQLDHIIRQSTPSPNSLNLAVSSLSSPQNSNLKLTLPSTSPQFPPLSEKFIRTNFKANACTYRRCVNTISFS
jgi:hypothetical protein